MEPNGELTSNSGAPSMDDDEIKHIDELKNGRDLKSVESGKHHMRSV